ncbi:MAG: hypothetical protein QOD06_1277 [Candidatus Binatota bacterium]|jgi:uncharacterized protein (DUF362 family)|nr:hypothetical protein [Candidatus Binatota bacterium]
MSRSVVAVVRTRPETVLEDYARVMRLARYEETLAGRDTLLKLNLSWTKYFPACSTEPWQLEGVVRTVLEDGLPREQLLPVENKTVVTNPREGCRNNLWQPILERYGLPFIPLPEVEWTVHRFRSQLLKLNDIFSEGIEIPKMYVGKNVIHLPTVKTHGHSTTTGAIKNAFGGLLKEVRHYAHKYIHEVMVDLVMMQKEIHPGVFAVMDGAVCGDGAGPRTMIPKVGNVLLASSDSVAIDAIAAQIMGFDPLEIPYLRMCHDRGLGVANPSEIELAGDDVSQLRLGFRTRKSLVIWGDQMLRKGALRSLEKIALHSPLVVWAPFASNVYHDLLWYPTVGRARIREFQKTEWGRLFERYRNEGTLGGPLEAPAPRAARVS